MTEDEQKKAILIGKINDKAVILGGQLGEIHRAKLNKLKPSELEKLASEVETAVTAYNIFLMIGQAAVESMQREKAGLDAGNPPAMVSTDQ